MSNPWFRLYSEFSHDPKVQMMSEVMQRRYIMILCMRCSNTLVTLHETEVAFHLRISNEELAETKALFIEKGFIDPAWNLLNWDKRQFASDTSKARVAKHRALQKVKQATAGNGDVTLLKRNDNALDTDTDTDTDTEEKKDKAQAPSFLLPAWVPVEAWSGYVEMRKKIRKPMTERAMQLRVNDLKKFADAGHDPAAVLDNSTANDWTDLYAPKAQAGKRAKSSCPKWVLDAGFANIHEANNEGCFERNAHEFQSGKRSEVAA